MDIIHGCGKINFSNLIQMAQRPAGTHMAKLASRLRRSAKRTSLVSPRCARTESKIHPSAPLACSCMAAWTAPAASMSHHDDQRRIQMLHRIFHTAKTVIAHQVSGISNDKQFSQTGVKNMLWRHSGISACEDHRTGFLALFRHTAPQALCNRGRIGLSVPIATVAANQPVQHLLCRCCQAYGHCQRRSDRQIVEFAHIYRA